LRITPASLRASSSFEIEYTAVYTVPGVTGGTPTTLQGKASLIIPSVVGDTPVFVDQAGHYELVGAARHQDGGRDAIDVRFPLIRELRDEDGSPAGSCSDTHGHA